MSAVLVQGRDGDDEARLPTATTPGAIDAARPAARRRERPGAAFVLRPLAFGVAVGLTACTGDGGGEAAPPPNDGQTTSTAESSGTPIGPPPFIDVTGGGDDGTGGTGTGGGQTGGTGTGGTNTDGTTGAGGADTGGTGTGGADTAGTTGTGGADTGGTGTGGTDTGGTDTGDTDTGGTETGGIDTGGTATGGDDPDGDDREGLVVEGIGDRSLDDLVSPWLLDATVFREDAFAPGDGEAFAYLLRYDDDFPVRAHVDFWTKELDTCRLTRPDDEPAEGEDEDEGGEPPPYISGGPSITVNTPAGPWLVIDGGPFRGDESQTFYISDDDGLPGPLPADATLSVPGDAFPTVAAFALPDEPPVPIRLTPSRDEALGLDTVYTWTPANGSDFVQLDFIATEPESGEFIDFPLFCQVVDDGEFRLPDAARTFLATASDAIDLRYARVRDTLTFSNEIVHRVRVIVAE